ncbi:hypothetical protein Tsubulata_016814 [Turnera subulata]|uniref:Uncharacterized protein n=1 Tax=Turnera subulata TaxID=218843 RepID=A0A9Q0F5J5_9ROSI|nr:hypothetical protein Tsubulata_016814 [Turnera subulata]
MAGRWWWLSTSAFRWLRGVDLVSYSYIPSSAAGILQWWPAQHLASPRRWPEMAADLSVLVDDVVWGVVTAVESVALVSMLCFFFLFCGCTV